MSVLPVWIHVISGVITQTPDNSNLFWFPLKVRVMGSWWGLILVIFRGWCSIGIKAYSRAFVLSTLNFFSARSHCAGAATSKECSRPPYLSPSWLRDGCNCRVWNTSFMPILSQSVSLFRILTFSEWNWCPWSSLKGSTSTEVSNHLSREAPGTPVTIRKRINSGPGTRLAWERHAAEAIHIWQLQPPLNRDRWRYQLPGASGTIVFEVTALT